MRINEKRIVGFALKNRLPSTYFYRDAVDAGGLDVLRGGSGELAQARSILR